MTTNKEIVEKAKQEVFAICKGKQWRMCIPVQPDDSDIVIMDGFHALEADLARLRGERAEDHAAIREVVEKGQKLIEMDHVNDDGNVTAEWNEAYLQWSEALEKHAPAIRRATGERHD